ncbi:predicted protein [Brucella sp. 83/13]|nr:predicted protein [Brucella sp. 83/13]
MLSVALSLGSPPPGVTRHRVSMEPGLSSPAAFRHMTGAAARPTDSAHIATIPRQRNRLCEKIATEIRKAGSKTAAGFSFTSGNPVLYAAADAKGMWV